MSDKCVEVISLRVTPLIKKEYDELNEIDRKHLKRMILNTMARFCWSTNHYDSKFYFDDGEEL